MNATTLTSSSNAPVQARDGIRGTCLLGGGVTLLLLCGLGGWAGTTSLAGAVVSAGTVVVESNVKKVQHQTGGIVGTILVHDGDRVRAGQVLARLDETVTRANLQIVSQQLDAAAVRKARLLAEATGASSITLQPAMAQRASEPGLMALLTGERALLDSRRRSTAGKEAQLATRERQYQDQIVGLNAQKQATDESLRQVDSDLATVESLYRRKLMPLERVSSLRIEATRLRGEAGRLIAAVAEIEGRISETRLQQLQLGEEMRKEVNTDLRETETTLLELVERKQIADDQLARATIRAPQDGIVQQLAVHTVGGIVAPGETLMEIVPASDALSIEARIATSSIDDVAPGQPVSIRFSAFDRNTTPECDGHVRHVSADLIKDPDYKTVFYEARIDFNDAADCLKASQRLLPGMPAEVYIQTGERGVWSYLMKPLTDQLARAFRE